jgi:hypothetical protein
MFWTEEGAHIAGQSQEDDVVTEARELREQLNAALALRDMTSERNAEVMVENERLRAEVALLRALVEEMQEATTTFVSVESARAWRDAEQ